MKKLGLLCMVMALFFSGCGKKKHDDAKQDKKDKSGKLFTSRKMEDAAPQYVEETSNLFEDEDSVTSLALADDDFDSLNDELNLDSDNTVNFAAVDFDDNDADFGQDDAVDNDIDSGLQTASLDDDYEDTQDATADFKTAGLDDLGLTFDLEEDNDDYDTVAQAEFETVHYGLNKREALTEEKTTIEKNLELAKRLAEEGKTITIAGHGCQLGSEAQNMLISAQRAQKMKNIFVEHGIPAEKIKTIGYGYEAPLVWSNAQNREQKIKELAPNRRIEITVS